MRYKVYSPTHMANKVVVWKENNSPSLEEIETAASKESPGISFEQLSVIGNVGRGINLTLRKTE